MSSPSRVECMRTESRRRCRPLGWPAVLNVTLVGGPTALIEYAGLRWLTDPTFSEPGTYDGLTKTTSPTLAATQVEPVDVVLLSHDQHSDNLDPAGREFLPRAGRV